MSTTSLPEPVVLTTERAAVAGFAMSCDPDTGRLLAVLAAAIPASGRVLELGTGTGVGTAWIVHGLQGRTDVEVLTVEIDPATAALAAKNPCMGHARRRRRSRRHPPRGRLRPDLR